MRFLLVAAVFVLFTFLFKKAAGTLNPKQLNITSFAYYLLLVQCFIGASCVFCGFRNHYLIQRVSDATVDKTYLILCYTIIMMPLTIWVCNILLGAKNIKTEYSAYTKRPVMWENTDRSMFVLVLLLTVVCIAAMVYVFWVMGYFPPLAFFTKSSEELALMRIQDTRGFQGNSYIRDIIMRNITPIVSYIAYVYMRKTKNTRWTVLFSVLFIMSVIAKVYNFEKSPVVYYVFYLYILEVLMGNVKSLKGLAAVGGVGIVAILFFYYFIGGYSGDLFTISTGPGGRIFLTQIATLFLHVEAFPALHPFLQGTSLPSFIADFFSLADSWVRSGAVVMEIFNPAAVQQGTAGVMNSIFSAEAWANWGTVGVIIAPIVVGAIYSACTCFAVKHQKTPAMVVIYLILFINFSQPLLGGFTDYLYPVTVLMLVSVCAFVEIMANGGKLRFTPGGVPTKRLTNIEYNDGGFIQ